jgi:hypothetical protein
MEEASRRFGKPIAYPSDIEQQLEAVGFINPAHKSVRIQMQPPKTAPDDSPEWSMQRNCRGAMFQTKPDPVRCESLEGMSMYLLTQYLPDWGEDDVRRICLDVARGCNMKGLPLFFNLYELLQTSHL